MSEYGKKRWCVTTPLYFNYYFADTVEVREGVLYLMRRGDHGDIVSQLFNVGEWKMVYEVDEDLSPITFVPVPATSDSAPHPETGM